MTTRHTDAAEAAIKRLYRTAVSPITPIELLRAFAAELDTAERREGDRD